jgi:DUF971 family protein
MSEATAEDQAAPIPVSIDREENSILIQWSDGLVTKRTAAELRAACPCATCREKKRGQSKDEGESKQPPGLPILSKAEAQPVRVESMRPVGSYAYQIGFSDGHSSGIYPFSLLRGEEG